MSAIDLDGLLRPVAEDAPAGPDLEYDPAYLAAFRAALGAPERRMGDTVVAAEEPDWRQVRTLCEALMTRSKDLRVGVLLTRALAHLQGFPGLADGLGLIQGLLERYWDDLYPLLDPEDDNDPTARINALVELCDREHLLDFLRTATLVRSPVFGPLTYRDIEVAEGHVSAPQDANTLDATAVNAVFQDCDIAQLEESTNAVSLTQERLRSVVDVLWQRIRTDQMPDLDPLTELLSAVEKVLKGHLEQRLPPTSDTSEAEAAQAQEAPLDQNAAKGPGLAAAPAQIASRDDVVRTIDRICDYYSRYEPSSPVPLLLKRARRLATGSFVDIVRDLAPEALTEIEKVCGLGEGSE